MKHVKEVKIWCANASATPKQIHISDNTYPSNEDDGEFGESLYFQLAGEAEVNPGELEFKPSKESRDPWTLKDVISELNNDGPASGFESFFSVCETFLFVFYRSGLRTRAYNYYFGKDPSKALHLLNTFTRGKTIKDVKKRPKVPGDAEGSVLGGRLVVSLQLGTKLATAMAASEDGELFGEVGKQALATAVLLPLLQ